MFWRASIRVDYWSEEAADRTAANHVLVSGRESEEETMITAIWETDDHTPIGSAITELIGRLEPELSVHLTDLGSVAEIPD